MNCIKCGHESDSDAEFCENCGSALVQICPNCNTRLKPGVSFCKKCGTPVSLHRPSIEEKRHVSEAQQSENPDIKENKQISSARLDGERKPVTILFTDIVGSTSLAEKLDPEEWKEVVSGAHQSVSQVVQHYEGTIAQLLGDGVLAFFGAPSTHEDDPLRAVHAALDIQEQISQYAYELRGYIDNFQMRIGLNTGMVVVGSMGSGQHIEYLAIGDAVNLAARLQSAAQPGKILISESTARLVQTAFELLPLGEITVKGKTDPINVYEVLESKATFEGSRGFEELASPMVGRTSELGELSQVLDELCHGHGQIVAVFGEAGIGKSRLIEEARCSIQGSGGVAKTLAPGKLHWIEGRALSYGSTLSFWTISQLIKNDLGLTDADSEQRIRLVLRRRVNDLFGDDSDRVLPYLTRLLGVKLDEKYTERVSELDGETLNRQTLISITRYFEKLANSQPTVAVFEDLHWADPSSLEALELLLTVTDHSPLMLLLLSRLEREQPAWQIKLKAETDFAHRYTEIQLKPLSTSQQNQLMDNLLGISDLPSQVRQLILERSEGNPFYLEEIARNLIEQGIFIREGDHWKATREILNVTIPDTLRGVLLARIDRLQEDMRHTLQLASVIGKSFLYSILDMINGAEQQLDQHLAQLQRVDLVREKSRIPELEYMFKHSLTQEAAYSSLVADRRYQFHRKVGEALEALFTDRLEEFYGILAYHFEAAGEIQKAIDYLIRAGDKARLMAELTEAIGFYQRALPFLVEANDPARLAQVWLKLGLVYCTNFQFEEAHLANEQAFNLQKQVQIPRQAVALMKPAVLRMCTTGVHVSIDPGKADWELDCRVISNLFAGLVQVDSELNVVPDVARSWQVLDNGRRYIFNLRDDVHWTDGSLVIAQDFEYAWKRNLHPDFSPDTETAQYLFDLAGAQDYHECRNSNPDSIGVRALDDCTLEVSLTEPVAYFPFILSMPVTFPLPRLVIERFGEDWCQAGKMISNGPYQLVNFDIQQGSVMERNPYYHGEYPGNVQRVELTYSRDALHLTSLYQEDSIDLAYLEPEILSSIPANERHVYLQPHIDYLLFSPGQAPTNDARVRRALVLGLDRNEFFSGLAIKFADGGMIPPGIPGHSPDFGLGYDLKAARQLLAEAGYPAGKGFPPMTGLIRVAMVKIGDELSRQWQVNLGIEVAFEAKNASELAKLRAEEAQFHLILMAWMLDYPDPDNIMCKPNAFLDVARVWGWHDETYLKLVKEAGRTANQKKRMEMYRQADRILVQEQVLVLPINYSGGQSIALVKPWLKNLQITPTGRIIIKNIIMEDH